MSSKEIEVAAEAIKTTMHNMYGLEPLDLDDRYQIARSVLAAAEKVRARKKRELSAHCGS